MTFTKEILMLDAVLASEVPSGCQVHRHIKGRFTCTCHAFPLPFSDSAVLRESS
jgi:hypothetical protein